MKPDPGAEAGSHTHSPPPAAGRVCQSSEMQCVNNR